MSSILSDISEKINLDGMKKSLSDVVNTIRSKIGLGEKSSDENVDDVADVVSVATAANPVVGVAQVATTRAVGKERVKEILWGIVYKMRDYIVEYGPIIEYFASSNIGIHWRENQEDLPDMLAQISLPIPLPPDEDEESAGSTN